MLLGFMFSEVSTVTMPVAATFSVMHAFKRDFLQPTLPGLASWLPPPPAQPLHVNTVAEAMTQCLLHPRSQTQPRTETYEVADILRLQQQQQQH
jgi:hypothetical protein